MVIGTWTVFLPEVAVTVTVYVPIGTRLIVEVVLAVVFAAPPPQPMTPVPTTKAQNIRGIARRERRPRFKPKRNSGPRKARTMPAGKPEPVCAAAVV